jgi:hypothetical protein
MKQARAAYAFASCGFAILESWLNKEVRGPPKIAAEAVGFAAAAIAAGMLCA